VGMRGQIVVYMLTEAMMFFTGCVQTVPKYSYQDAVSRNEWKN